MTTQVNKAEIYSYLDSWSGYDTKGISEEGEAYKTTVTAQNKKVVVLTPYEVGEFFLDFFVGDDAYYSDWFEIVDDDVSEFMEYTKEVVDRFLNNEVRVKTNGWLFFKTYSLEFCKDGAWRNVFTT